MGRRDSFAIAKPTDNPAVAFSVGARDITMSPSQYKNVISKKFYLLKNKVKQYIKRK